MNARERHHVEAYDMRCLRPMCGITINMVKRNQEIQELTWMKIKLGEQVRQAILTRYGHDIRMK